MRWIIFGIVGMLVSCASVPEVAPTPSSDLRVQSVLATGLTLSVQRAAQGEEVGVRFNPLHAGAPDLLSVTVGDLPAQITSSGEGWLRFTVPQHPALSGSQPVRVEVDGSPVEALLDVLLFEPQDSEVRGQYLVTLRPSVHPTPELMGKLSAAGFTLLETATPEEGPGICAQTLLVVQSKPGQSTGDALAALQSPALEDDVYWVDPNGSSGLGGQSPALPGDQVTPTITSYRADLGLDDLPATLLGQGVTIAVLDTGVSAHRDLAGRVLSGGSFSASGWSTNSDDVYNGASVGHGTAVADLAAGTQVGIAPKAQVLAVRVCDASGRCRAQDVLRGLCSVLARTVESGAGQLDPNALILNLSLGGTLHFRMIDDALHQAVDQGVLIAAAAGNGRLTGNRRHYPAAQPFGGLLTVGALEKRTGNLAAPGEREPWGPAAFSTESESLKLSAPGQSVLSASTQKGGNGALTNEFDAYTGTSFATPLVAGALALTRQAYPSLTPAQIEDLLLQRVRPLPSAPRQRVGYGMLDLSFLTHLH